ncbi:MAG: dNTP triphosphohydrolase [Candidatus Methanofastidiosa archaeon]|nr:dNTP triphosphohydrolase [Candidatus Methanofastidiosa archaeon]
MKGQEVNIVTEKWFSADESLCKEKGIFPRIIDDSKFPISYRSIFDQDRDRIIYSKVFRRMNGKTQIFIPNTNDYVRTRLTHSLEVNQIARSVAKGLGLNISLVEAIALGHDVGHTPFGHSGEYELNRIMNNCSNDKNTGFPLLEQNEKGFKHNFQSVRALAELSTIYDQPGLNLSSFTLWGILNHTSKISKQCRYLLEQKNETDKTKMEESCIYKSKYNQCKYSGLLSLGFYDNLESDFCCFTNKKPSWSFEAIVVNLADEIAQFHHDIEDSIFMKIIELNDATTYIKKCFEDYIQEILDKKTRDQYLDLIDNINSAKSDVSFMSFSSKMIINFLVNNLILSSRRNLVNFAKDNNIKSRNDFINFYKSCNIKTLFNQNESLVDDNQLLNMEKNRIIGFSSDMKEPIDELKKTFYNRVINSEEVQKLNNLGERVIFGLFYALYENPRLLTDKTVFLLANRYEGIKEFNNAIEIYQNRTFKDREKYNSKIKEALGEIRNNINIVKSTVKNKKILMRTICDHISGMTDTYALNLHREIYGSNFKY